MKLCKPIIFDDGTFLEEVCPCDAGVYLIFRVPSVQRGIKGKSRSKVDEVLIYGLPWDYANKFLSKFGITIKKV